MDQQAHGALAAQLPAQLRRELTRALASTPRSAGVDRYITWLQDSLGRVSGSAAADNVQAVYDEWVATRPRCARRATNAGPHVHA